MQQDIEGSDARPASLDLRAGRLLQGGTGGVKLLLQQRSTPTSRNARRSSIDTRSADRAARCLCREFVARRLVKHQPGDRAIGPRGRRNPESDDLWIVTCSLMEVNGLTAALSGTAWRRLRPRHCGSLGGAAIRGGGASVLRLHHGRGGGASRGPVRRGGRAAAREGGGTARGGGGAGARPAPCHAACAGLERAAGNGLRDAVDRRPRSIRRGFTVLVGASRACVSGCPLRRFAPRSKANWSPGQLVGFRTSAG